MGTRVENQAAQVMNNAWEEYAFIRKNRLNAGPVLETFYLVNKTLSIRICSTMDSGSQDWFHYHTCESYYQISKLARKVTK